MSSDDRPTLDALADLRVRRAARAYRRGVVRLEMASAQLLTTVGRNDIGTRGAVRRGRPVEGVGPTAAAYMSALDAKNLADRALTAALDRERETRGDRLRAVLANAGMRWPDGLNELEHCLRLQRMAAGEPAPDRSWSMDEVRLAEELSELVLAHLDGDQAVLDSLPGKDLGDLPLVMVGGAPYASRFIASFTRGADPRVLFPGPIYGDGYRELLSHSLAYIHATEVGGTHPALVEAMGYGNCVLVNDMPENREVAGGVALYFRAAEPASLAAAIERARLHPERARARGRAAARRAALLFSWERVADRYAGLLRKLSYAGHA